MVVVGGTKHRYWGALEDLSLFHKTYIKKLIILNFKKTDIMACNPRSRQMQKAAAWGSLASKPSLLAKL